MLLPAEFAPRDEEIDVGQLPFQRVRETPELGRPLVGEHALHAGARVAGLAIESPQDVGRTHQPVLVRDVYLEGVAAVRQQTRSANQRYVVEHDHVEGAFAHQPPNGAAVHDRPAESDA